MQTKIDRRTALAWGAAGLAAGTAEVAAARQGAAVRKRRLDPANPEDARLIARKLRYRTDSGLLFSWIKGPYMAEIDGDLIPMYAINLGSIQRVEQRADGGFNLSDLEISFRVDVETGKRVSSFRNPVTGEDLQLPVNVQGPNHLTVSRDNVLQIADIPGGPRFALTHHPSTPFQLGGDVFMRDRSHSVVTFPDGSTSNLNEVSTLSAPASQVLDPHTTMADTRVQSNDVRSWPAWLRMGARPGMLALFGNGAKVRSFADMPADWQELLDQYAPEIARDPVAALDRVVKR